MRKKGKVAPRQIVGISLPPAVARAFKTEASRRGLSLRALFEEMWRAYKSASEQQKP